MKLKHGLLFLAAMMMSTAAMSKSLGNYGYHKHINVLEEYSAGPQLEGKARVRIRFHIDNFIHYRKLNIVAVDFCHVPRRCERVKELTAGAQNADDGQVIFGHALTTTGVKGKFLRIYTKKKHKNYSGYKLVQTHLRLDDVINLDNPYGYDVFIDLKKVGRKIYKPKFLAYAPTVPSADSVILFNPELSSEVSVNDGITVNIPEYAINQSTVIGVEGNRQGYTTGSLIVSPELTFESPLSVDIAFDPNVVTGGNLDDVYDITLSNNKLSTEFITTDSEGREVYRVHLNQSGFVSILSRGPDLIPLTAGALRLQKSYQMERPTSSSSALQSESLSIEPSSRLVTAAAAALPSDPCVNALNAIGGASAIYNNVDLQAASLYNQCTSVYPNVHILVYRATDLRNTTIFSREVATSGTHSHKLKRISDHANYVGAWAMINGFVWSGDSGFANSTGDFIGTQIINGQQLGSTNSAEAAIGFTVKLPDFNWPDFFLKAANTTPNYSPYDYNVVSSSSSIIKGGVCNSTSSSPGPSNRWSAMGVRYDVFGDGYIVMLSSTSSGSTTPYDLCQVFKALDVPNAIRLDGSSATSLYVGGTHVNPIVGATSYIFGSARHVLYGIGVK